MDRSRIAGPSRAGRDEHRPLAGAPTADPGGLAGALKPGRPPVGDYSGRPGADLLTGAYLIADTLQPASYGPARKTISAMAGQAGTDRWVMTGGIFLTGGCYPPHRRGPDRCPGIRPLMQFAVGLTVSVRPARRPHRLRRPWQHAGPTEKDDMTMTTDR